MKDRDPISKVALLGSEGKIGTVMQAGLTDFDVTPLDLPGLDIRDYDALLEQLAGHDAVINLAHNPPGVERENCRNEVLSPDNVVIVGNVYSAARELGMRRAVMASSVHADNFYDWDGPGLMGTDRIGTPTTPYGANKILTEALGRYHAQQGLEVVCVRFGGVNEADVQPVDDEWERRVWLSHEDASNMMQACLRAEEVPGNFAALYAVSDNEGRVHDTQNPFGWEPKARGL